MCIVFACTYACVHLCVSGFSLALHKAAAVQDVLSLQNNILSQHQHCNVHVTLQRILYYVVN